VTLPSSGLAGLLLATIVVFVAYRAAALTATGAAAAWCIGVMSMAAGWSWGAVLIAYFVVSSALSRFRAAEKHARTSDRLEKPGARDHKQVLANGAIFGFMALNFSILPWELWQVLAAGALAASTADTWATETGTLARSEARSILGFHPVPAGTSGGVTAVGLAGSIAGAAFVAGVAWLVRWPMTTVVAALAGGLLGSLIDSVLGASLQARRHCRKCNMATEQARHRCGMPTDITGGFGWLDNDGVNTIATFSGAVLGALAATFI